MIKTVLGVVVVLLFGGCNNSNTNPGSKKVKDPSLQAEYYAYIEKSVQDSITKYGLDTINEMCKEMLYVLYASDTIITDKENNIITIGECNIRLFNFQNVTTDLKYIHYVYYINDSTVVDWDINQKREFKMVHSFEVDVKTQKITKALISEHASMQIRDIEKAFDSIKISNGFKNYLSNYKDRLHPNFKMP